MGIVNDMILGAAQQPQAGGVIPGVPVQAPQDGGFLGLGEGDVLDKIIRLIEQVNQLISNPFIAQRFMGGKVAGSQSIGSTSAPVTVMPTNPQNLIADFLKRPTAKDDIKGAIDKLMMFTGDVKLSELKAQIDKLDMDKIKKLMG